MEYVAPSKEFIGADQDDSDNNSEIQGGNHDSDETSVIDASRPVLSQYNSTALQAGYQTDQDKSTGTSPTKFSF